MAKNTITRAQALTAAIAKFDADAPEVVVLSKMLDSITKPRVKSGAPSKAAQRNAVLAAKVLQAMPADTAVDSLWIAAHVDGFNVNTDGKVSSQHITAVMRMLVETGKVSKAKVGKRMAYTLV